MPPITDGLDDRLDGAPRLCQRILIEIGIGARS